LFIYTFCVILYILFHIIPLCVSNPFRHPQVSVDALVNTAADHKERVVAVVDGLSLRSPLLDVYGQPRAVRVQLPYEAPGLAAAVPNVAYMATEAEVQAKQRAKTMSTMNQEKLALTQPLNYNSLLAGTALHPSQVEAQPTLAALSGAAMSAAHVAFAEFRMLPAAVDFGPVQVGCTYRVSCQLVNCGHHVSRFSVAAPAHSHNLLRMLYRPGPVPPGMSVRIELELFVGQEGLWQDAVVVTSERSVFQLPVGAQAHASLPPSDPLPSVAAASTFDNSRQARGNANNTATLGSTISASKASTKLGASRLVANIPSVQVQVCWLDLCLIDSF
jgi:hypothetical protein